MPTLDERVAYLEGRFEEHSGSESLRGDVHALSDETRGEMRSAGHRLDSRIDTLYAKVSRHFTWLVGIQVAVLIAIAGALLR